MKSILHLILSLLASFAVIIKMAINIHIENYNCVFIDHLYEKEIVIVI